MYVFDNLPLSTLFRNFYRNRFPSLWQKFDALVANGSLISVREAYQEIQDSNLPDLREWAKDHEDLFPAPSADEGAFIAEIYAVRHFQQNIELQKLLKGGRNADPFVIAKAAIDGSTVVTMELLKKDAAKIPNICDHFGIPCMTLEQFMEAEGWQF